MFEWVPITTNKQVIPDDPNAALRPSGIRLGTPAATTRGMKEEQMEEAALCIVEPLRNPNRQSYLANTRSERAGWKACPTHWWGVRTAGQSPYATQPAVASMR